MFFCLFNNDPPQDNEMRNFTRIAEIGDKELETKLSNLYILFLIMS